MSGVLGFVAGLGTAGAEGAEHAVGLDVEADAAPADEVVLFKGGEVVEQVGPGLGVARARHTALLWTVVSEIWTVGARVEGATRATRGVRSGRRASR